MILNGEKKTKGVKRQWQRLSERVGLLSIMACVIESERLVCGIKLWVGGGQFYFTRVHTEMLR